MLKKILIVDDSEVNRRLLRGILQDDYVIDEVDNGKEVYEKMRASKPQYSAVLLDLLMPEFDGFDVLKQVRADSELSQIPIIVATASTDERAEENALKLGATDFIRNPYTPVIVKHRVDNIINLITVQKSEAEARRQLRALMQNVNAGINIVFVDSADKVNLVFANDNYYELIGYSKQETTTIPDLFDLIHDEDRYFVRNQVVESQKKHTPFTSTFRVKRKDGKVIWCLDNVSFIRLEGYDNPLQFSVLSDISDKIEATKQATDANNRLQAFVRGFDGGISVASFVDGKTNYYYTNDVYYDMFGYTKEQFDKEAPNGLIDLIYPDDIPLVANVVSRSAATNASQTIEYRVIKRDGSIIWVRSHNSCCALEGIDVPVHIAVSTDITTEKLLSARADTLHNSIVSLMDDTPGGFARYFFDSEKSGLVYANLGYYKMRGFSHSGLIDLEGNNALAGIHPEDEALMRDAFPKSLDNDNSGTIKARLLCGDGEYKWFSVFARFSKEENGKNYINAYYSDLTEKERQELVLRSTLTSSLNALMKSTTDLAFAKDKEFKYVCASTAYAKALGLESEEELIGKTDYELFAKSFADKYRAEDTELLKGGKSIVDKVECLPVNAKDGITHYLSTSKYVLTDIDGEAIGIYGICRDITKYRTSFQQLELLTDSIPGGLAVYKCYKNGKVEIDYFNEGYSKITGYSYEEIKSLNDKFADMIVSHEDKEEMLKELNYLIGMGVPFEHGHYLHAKDGSLKWVSAYCSIAEKEDNYVTVNFLVIDRTEEKKAQDELLRSQENTKSIKQLCDESSSLVYVCDASNYQLIYINDKTASVCGVSAKDASGKTCYQLLGKRDKPCPFCPIKDTAENCYTEREITNAKGTKHYVARDKLMNWQGTKAFVRYLVDETERIETQHNIVKMLDGIPGGIGIHNVYDDGHVEMVFVNKGYYDMLGTRKEDRTQFLGGNSMSVIHPNDLPLAKHEIKAAITEKRIGAANLRMKMANGDYKWLNVKVVVAGRDGNKTRMYLTYSDVDREINALNSLQESYSALNIAGVNANITFWLLNLDTKTATLFEHQANDKLGSPFVSKDVPDSLVRSKAVHEDDVEAYLASYKRIYDGDKCSECTVRIYNYASKKYEWQRLIHTRLPDTIDGKRQAIGMSINADSEQEALKKYQHENSLRTQMVKESIFYYEINLTKGFLVEYQSKLTNKIDHELPAAITKQMRNIILKDIAPQDKEKVENTIFSKALLKAYQEGKTSVELTYRRQVSDKGLRWVKSNVSIRSNPTDNCVYAFLYAYDVDNEVRAKLVADSIVETEIEAAFLLRLATDEVHIIKETDLMNGFQEGDTLLYDDFQSRSANYLLSDSILDANIFFSKKELISKLKKEPKVKTICQTVADGKIRRKRISAYYLDSSHEDIVFLRRDITYIYEEEQRQKENLKKAVAAAKEANQAKSEFLSRMSHDMRTPLNAIIGLVNLAKDETVSPKTAEYLANISTSSKFLTGLINDVLDLTKIESGRVQLNEEPYSYEEFMRNISIVIKPLMDTKNIEFVVDRKDTHKFVLVDKIRLNQVFLNLLSNAAKYTPWGGRVDLIIESISGKDDKIGLRFHVKDDGIGMSEDFVKTVFEPFSQEKVNSNPEIQGSGLGLPIVKSIIEAMGGVITVKSQQGVGSEFIVDLYLKEAETVEPEKVELKYPDSLFRGKRVLVVDDNELNLIIASKILEKKGCETVLAVDGKQAVKLFAEAEAGYFNAILMDVRMPVMDGITATKVIRALDKADAKTVPIIALTADAFLDDKAKTIEAGMNAHIAKPIEPEVLYACLVDLTEKRNVHNS